MFKHKQNGFSLIELMTAIAVLGVVLAIAFPSFRVFTANTQIRSTAESIRNGLQMARGAAIKHNAVVRFSLANDTSWTISCVTVTANCPAVIQTKPSKEGSASTIVLGITGTNTLDFTSLGTLTSVLGQMSQVNIDSSAITSAQSRDLRITINAGGSARICDPNVAASSDSRNCTAN